MRFERAGNEPKGWLIGAWNSQLEIAVGFANEGVDEPHFHRKVSEIYLVTRGTCEMRVNGEIVKLGASDMILIEPGEAHTFVASSDDYFHFVIHTPSLSAEEAKADKVEVSRSSLGI